MKSIRLLLIGLGLMLGINNLHSQPILEWANIFNGDADSIDVANDVTVDNAGNSYVTGKSFTLLNLLTSVVTISYDAAGNQRWRSVHDVLLNDEGKALVLDNTQQYLYVTGYQNNLLGLGAAGDYFIAKYNAATGQEMWVRTYNGGLLTDDIAYAITVDNQNNPVITGASQGFLLLLSPYDYATVKFDQTTGAQIWARRYNGPANGVDEAFAIVADNNNNIIVTGASKKGFILYDDDYATVKYNSNGTQLWAQRYNGPGNNEDRSYAIVVDNADNVIVSGSSFSGSTQNTKDYATVKYTSGGAQQWVARYNGTGNNQDRSYAIVVDNADNVIVTGESMGSGSNYDYATVKYTPTGSQSWAQRYNGPGNNEDRSYAIVVDNADNVFVTGSSRSTGAAGSEDYATLQYTPTGTQSWVVRHNGTGNNEDRSYAIVVDNADNIYLTGYSRNSNLFGSEDYLTVKYSNNANPLSVISNEIPVKSAMSQNYPNPFNPKTNINFDLASLSNVKITVYDILGNAVAVIINSRLNPGKYSVEWDAVSFPSGIYFYRINAENFTETKKLILAK